jgi:hypothetical protein
MAKSILPVKIIPVDFIREPPPPVWQQADFRGGF